MRRLPALLCLLLTGCFLFRPGSATEKVSNWYEVGTVLKPKEEITRAIREMVTRNGYQIPQFDAAATSLATDWDVHLSTRYHEGYRTMIEAELRPPEIGGGFNVRVRST